jgi:uncharacterized protein
VALAWDSHVHHAAIRAWFAAAPGRRWATCPITEAGFVRVSANPKVLASPIGAEDARRVLAAMRHAGGHRFVANDVSMTDPDVVHLTGHRQVTDAILLALARRQQLPLVTFDAGVEVMAQGEGVELLVA